MLTCQEFFIGFFKIFCNDNLGSRAHARDGARPWVVTLKGLDAVMELDGQSGLTGLHCVARSAMFGIPNSYP